MFQNTEIAFKAKSNKDLKRAHLLFKLVGNPVLMKMGKWFTLVALSLHIPIKWAVKATLFRQFCGGENISECQQTIANLAKHGVESILDFSVEGQTEEHQFDAATMEIIATIDHGELNVAIPFCVFKVTGIARFELLEKINTKEQLTPKEEAEYRRVFDRVERICARAHQTGTPVFVDAEETWIQDPIDEMATRMMAKFNREKVVVYNTVQLYRHDRLEYTKIEIEKARAEGYHLGLKLVRGAYMEKERERAEERGYPSPIQPDKAASDRDYDAALRLTIENLDSLAIVAGTHNEASSELLAKLMAERGIANNDSRVYFSQLYGMGDHISFNLAELGYNVVKYVPYGPVRKLLPYLIRRAVENSSAAGQSSRELNLIKAEVERRKQLA